MPLVDTSMTFFKKISPSALLYSAVLLLFPSETASDDVIKKLTDRKQLLLPFVSLSASALRVVSPPKAICNCSHRPIIPFPSTADRVAVDCQSERHHLRAHSTRLQVAWNCSTSPIRLFKIQINRAGWEQYRPISTKHADRWSQMPNYTIRTETIKKAKRCVWLKY